MKTLVVLLLLATLLIVVQGRGGRGGRGGRSSGKSSSSRSWGRGRSTLKKTAIVGGGAYVGYKVGHTGLAHYLSIFSLAEEGEG